MPLGHFRHHSSENTPLSDNEKISQLALSIDILEFNQRFEHWVSYFFENQNTQKSERKYRKYLKNTLENYLDFFATNQWKNAHELDIKAKHEDGRKYRQILFGAKESPYSHEENMRLKGFVSTTRSRVNSLLDDAA